MNKARQLRESRHPKQINEYAKDKYEIAELKLRKSLNIDEDELSEDEVETYVDELQGKKQEIIRAFKSKGINLKYLGLHYYPGDGVSYEFELLDNIITGITILVHSWLNNGAKIWVTSRDEGASDYIDAHNLNQAIEQIEEASDDIYEEENSLEYRFNIVNAHTGLTEFEDLSLYDTLTELEEYLSEEDLEYDDVIILDSNSGQIINDCKYFYHDSNPNQKHTIFEILNLAPYFDKAGYIQYQPW